jgi:WD40 repeat protein
MFLSVKIYYLFFIILISSSFLHAQERALGGHTYNISQLCYTPDGRYVITSSWNNAPKLMDVSTGTIIRTFYGLSKGASVLAVSPDGTKLAACTDGDEYGHTIVWEIQTGELLKTIDASNLEREIASLSFSADGKSLMIQEDQYIRIFNVDGFSEIKKIWHKANFKYAHFRESVYLPDGKNVIVINRSDNKLEKWAVDSDKNKESKSNSFQGWPSAIILSPDGKLVAINTAKDYRNHKVTVYETASLKKICEFGENNFSNTLGFSNDSKKIVYFQDSTLATFDIEKKQMEKFPNIGIAKQWYTALGISPDGKFILLATLNKGELIKVNRLENKIDTVFLSKASAISSMSVSPDGEKLAVGGDRLVRIYDLPDLLNSKLIPNTENCSHILYSPNNKYLAYASKGKFVVLDAHTLEAIIQNDEPNRKTYYGLDFLPDGNSIVVNSNLGEEIWNLELKYKSSFTENKDSSKARDKLRCIKYSPDGNTKAIGKYDQDEYFHYLTSNSLYVSGYMEHDMLTHTAEPMLVYDKITGNFKKLEGRNTVNCIAFSSDGKYLASGSGEHTSRSISSGSKYSEDNVFRIWAVDSYAYLYKYDWFRDKVRCLSFSPDNKYLVAGAADHRFTVYNIEKGMKEFHIVNTGQDINAITYSTDGNYIIMGGAGGMIQIWQVKSAQMVREIIFEKE